MKTRNLPLHIPLVAALFGILIAALSLPPATFAQNGVSNRGVLERMNNMADAQAAIETLVNMMSGRIRFDRVQARAVRRNMINTMRNIPALFKTPHSDPLSRARPEIWTLWDDFNSRAESAKRIARRLNASRLGTLRATLPDMINACLSCHNTYRKPR